MSGIHELHETEKGYDEPFVMIYHSQLDLLAGEPYALAVFVALLRRANRQHGNRCFPNLNTIADDSGVSRSSIKRSIKKLQELGLLRVTARKSENGDATSNLYTLLRPRVTENQGRSPENPPSVPTEPTVGPDRTPNKTKSEPEELGLDLVGDMQREQDVVPERTKPKPPRKTSTAIDDDFWPASPGIEKWATENHVPLSAIHAEVPKFIDHHAAKGSRMVDWDRAFYTWLRNAKSWGHLDPIRGRTTSRAPGKKGFTPDELMQRYFDKHGGGWND